MKAIAFVQGPQYSRMAEHTLPRASEVLSMNVILREVPPERNLWFDKLYAIEESIDEPVLCFDVDLVFCNWDWSALHPLQFNAVLDYPLPTWRHGAKFFNTLYPVERAINAGLWYAPPSNEVRAVFKRARELLEELKDFRYPFGDQTALNKAIHESGLEVNLLPNSYNWQVAPKKPLLLPPGTHVGHAIGDSFAIDGEPNNLPRKLSRVLEMLRLNPPWQNNVSST